MNAAPDAVDLIVHVRIVMSIVIGLGITRVLTSLAAVWVLFYTNDCPGKIGVC